MKSFFEEYGFVILAAIVVILLIAMATPIGDLVKIQVSEVVNSFGSKTQSKLNATDGIIQVRVSTANNKITLEWDANKKEDVFKCSYKASNTSKDANWTPVTDIPTGSDKSRKVEITSDSNNQPLANKTKVEYKIYDSNDVLVASGIVIAKINGNTVDNDVNEGISKTDSFVGYYADTNGDGTVDGIIFADLAVGGSGTWNPSGESWANSTGTYSYGTIPADELKDYVISEGKYSGKFGEKPIVKAVGNGKDRFYVMALENIDSSTYTWYANAYNNGNGLMTDYASTTSPNFGAGKTNTAIMINKWNNQAYGPQNTRDGYKDLWGKVSAGSWFVPSKMEWATFAGELGVTKANYSSLGLSSWSWSSSQASSTTAWVANFRYGYVLDGNAHRNTYVRLATTF